MARTRDGVSAGTLAGEWYAEHNPDAPMSAMLELADRCNETCVHCYQVQGQKGELETADWRKILDELAALGVLFLVLSGGEVTLRKDFLGLVEYARSLGFAVKIYTNGLTMTESLAGALAAHAVHEVQLSLYSPRAEVHDWITGVPGAFERTTAGVRYLVKAGVRTVVKTPLMSVNTDDFVQFRELADELGANFSVDQNLSAREDGATDPLAMSWDDEQLRAVLPELVEPNEIERDPSPLGGRPCGACAGVHVEANGDMRPCTALPISVGHAIEQGVRKAHRSDEAAFIRTITWGTLTGCRDCDLRSYCSRCHADARWEGGDALGPYRKACGRALLSYEARHGHAPEVRATDGTREDMGPYRRIAAGQFEALVAQVSDEDESLRQQHPWIRRTPDEATARATPGQLVQLRRPGRSKARPEAVPSPSGAHVRNSQQGDACVYNGDDSPA